MNTKTKKRLCWNCEGEVLLNAEQCPFCGVSMDAVSMQENKSKDALAPPYKLVNASPDKIPSSPYKKSQEKANQEKANQEKAKKEPPKEEPPKEHEEDSSDHGHGDPRHFVLSLAFMLSGAAFAIFGIVLWLFADHNGHLTLRWNAHYWYVYLLVSLPLLYLGCKATQKARKDEEE